MLTQPILVDVFFLRFKPLPGGLIFWGPPKEGDGKKTSRRKKRSGCAELARARKEGFLALPVSWLEKRGGFKVEAAGNLWVGFRLGSVQESNVFLGFFLVHEWDVGFQRLTQNTTIVQFALRGAEMRP